MHRKFKTVLRPALFILGALIWSGDMLIAQPEIAFGKLYDEYRTNKRRNARDFDYIEGSPYKNPEFLEGSVYLKTNAQPVNAKLRYNNVFDEIEYIADSSDNYLILDNKTQIDSIHLNGNTFRYLVYPTGKDIISGYFVFLTGTKCQLFMKEPFAYQPEKPPTGGYQEYIPAKFVKLPEEFYVILENGKLFKLPESKRKIIDLLEEHGYRNIPDMKIKYAREELISLIEQLCD